MSRWDYPETPPAAWRPLPPSKGDFQRKRPAQGTGSGGKGLSGIQKAERSPSCRKAAPGVMKMDDSPFEGGVGGCPGGTTERNPPKCVWRFPPSEGDFPRSRSYPSEAH